MSFEITIEKTQNSRIGQFDPENIGFGKIFTDHMFLAHWDGTAWTNARIVPYGPLSLSPATSAIHYGQSIFEGMKAFADKQTGQPLLFRPRENWKRLNRSAERMVMPVVPEDLFMDGLKTLIQLDAEWVPKTEGGSLYIRPYMFATDDFIGVKPSETYTFAIFCCPVGPYYTKALKIKVEEEFSRAAPAESDLQNVPVITVLRCTPPSARNKRDTTKCCGQTRLRIPWLRKPALPICSLCFKMKSLRPNWAIHCWQGLPATV